MVLAWDKGSGHQETGYFLTAFLDPEARRRPQAPSRSLFPFLAAGAWNTFLRQSHVGWAGFLL